MGVEFHEYRSTWRATPGLLWGIAAAVWLLGAVLEVTVLPGAVSASGGLVVASTTPLFIVSLAKQSAYDQDIKLALINLRRERNLANGVWDNLTQSQRSAIEPAIVENENGIRDYEEHMRKHRAFLISLTRAEAWVLGLASAIWATGDFVANLFFHCQGALTC
jgi:hypothetical protein